MARKSKIRGVEIDEVIWWEDPDQGRSSGWYRVFAVNGKRTEQELNKEINEDHFSWEDAIISIVKAPDGSSEAEVPLSEIWFGC